MNIELNCVYTDADINAFAKNYSRCVLKNVRTAWIVLAVMSALALLLNIRDMYFGIIGSVLAALFAVSLFYIIYDPIQKRLIKANAYIKGCRTKLVFYDDYYYEKSESAFTVTETSVRYEYIKSVYETQTHIFIYTNSGHCHIVPRKEFYPDDYLVLRAFLTSRIGAGFKTV